MHRTEGSDMFTSPDLGQQARHLVAEINSSPSSIPTAALQYEPAQIKASLNSTDYKTIRQLQLSLRGESALPYPVSADGFGVSTLVRRHRPLNREVILHASATRFTEPAPLVRVIS